MADTSVDVCETNSSATGIVASNVEENLKCSRKITKTPEHGATQQSNRRPFLANIINYLKNLQIRIMTSTVSDEIPKKYVKHTCGFDSVLQVIICALKNSSSLQESLETSENAFIKIAQYAIIHGWENTNITQLRINLLYDYLGNDKSRFKNRHGRLILNCEISVPYVIYHTFRNDPSCEEISKCANGCTNVSKKRTFLTIPYTELRNEKFDDVIADHLSLSARPCDYCTSMVETKLEMTGSFMFFEIYDNNTQMNIELKCIPQSFSITVHEEKRTYKLRGIISFIRPCASLQISVKQLSESPVGHYTAICPDPINGWIEYDINDNKYPPKTFLRTNQFKCSPGLLIYSIL